MSIAPRVRDVAIRRTTAASASAAATVATRPRRTQTIGWTGWSLTETFPPKKRGGRCSPIFLIRVSSLPLLLLLLLLEYGDWWWSRWWTLSSFNSFCYLRVATKRGGVHPLGRYRRRIVVCCARVVRASVCMCACVNHVQCPVIESSESERQLGLRFFHWNESFMWWTWFNGWSAQTLLGYYQQHLLR